MATKPFDWGEPRIEWVDLETLKKWPRNPKAHDLGFFDAVFKINGFAQLPHVDEITGCLVDGNGRIEKLDEMKAAGLPAPPRIRVKGDRWFVPIVRGMRYPAPGKHVIAANRGVELGGWNDLLAPALAVFGKDDLEGTGFGADDFAHYMTRSRSEAREGLTDGEAVPDLPKKTVTKLGDLWQLGDHRLLCGETCDPSNLRRLCGGETLVMLHADPPYGMGKEGEGIENDNLYAEKLDKFQSQWWSTWRRHLSEIGSLYVWGNAPDLWRWWWRHLEPSTRDEKAPVPLMVRNEIAWDKGFTQGQRTASAHSFPPATERALFMMLGRQFLGNQNADEYSEGYEPLRAWMEGEQKKAGWDNPKVNKLTATKMASHWFTRSQFIPINRDNYEILQKGAKGAAFVEPFTEVTKRFAGPFKHRRELSAQLRQARTYFDNTHDSMTDVWQFPRVQGEERFGHSTPKPVAMAARALKTSSPTGGAVGVPFVGTGPEYIAGEQWDRRVFGIDNGPAYVDVVVDRWQQFSGRKAKLLRR